MTLILSSRTWVLASSAALCLLVVACQAAKQPHAEPLAQAAASLVSKTLPAQTRTRQSRSLSDMFEKVKSKLFGSRKQGQVAGVSQPLQAAGSSNVAAIQRQPWNEINSFNQQYPSMVGYQGWPQQSAASAANQFMQQPYGSMGSYMASQPGSAGFGQSSQSILAAMDPQQQQSQMQMQPQPQHQIQQQQQPQSMSSATGSESGGLLASASQLFTRFMSPNSAATGSQVNGQQQQQQQNSVSPQQQQQQSQYNEFASILDSMVAQTGASSQPRQPSQYQSAMQPQQQPQMPQGFQSAGQPLGDTDMSGSSNIQSYLPASGAQPSPAASSKSSMVSLAEQLAPGAAFNKLVSFPFSLTNNDDPTKEGKYKLHIPFLNQHVKRSDQQAAVSQQQQQQQQRFAQQYLNSLINQQYLAAAAAASSASQQQQQHAQQQSSQVAAGPQSLTSGQGVAPSQQSVSSAVAASAQANQSAVAPSSSSSSSSSSSLLPAASSPIASSSQVIGSSNPNARQSWSVSESQSSAASSSKLIPMSSSSSLVDSGASSEVASGAAQS